jgi:hypothetical protein
MRLVSSVFALAVLGCCFGPSVEAPPAPAPVAPSPLSQALQGMGAADAPIPPPAPVAAIDTPAPAAVPAAVPVAVPATPPAPASPGAALSPACADAQAAREAIRAELRDLRLTLGGDSTARVEAAGAAMMVCNTDPDCVRDPKLRMAKVEVYDRAKAVLAAETTRLAEAEVGLYGADQRVVGACGAP